MILIEFVFMGKEMGKRGIMIDGKFVLFYYLRKIEFGEKVCFCNSY